ncbi:TIGR02677 family protein [Streptomyces sp. NBC_00525]|uniref:TIGR02677 family protein n=1 Tax=Streptomyces sp. NBC_00525 TaxID=2903660 RepID=UPI002E81E6EE|nr:TIGR02677 family protein [Streptomyces sp. NBC_00525]WUC92113.1 TIGR02677 family protein [Streptomyces sp. NBC_00525]WUC97532.1 TIGR02677 family protein [Streptomyces sp. NBC_00525]
MEEGLDAHAPDPEPDERQLLYRHVTAEHSTEYLAIMRLFTETLLADLSAEDVRTRLAERGIRLSLEQAEDRCIKLVGWKNLMPSMRDPRVPTVAAFQHARRRFQTTRLGSAVQRQIDEILQTSDGAREVARELLGSMVTLLDRILRQARTPHTADAEALAADVTTLFNNQKIFVESVRDFYTYLSSVLSRYDLVDDEYASFKGLLLEYVDLIDTDVSRHAPAVLDRLEQLEPIVGSILAVLDNLPGLTSADPAQVQRLPGRQRTDWTELLAWYSGSEGPSGPSHLRSAAEAALNQLITNARRLLASAGTTGTRRADLLHLAALFTQASAEEAHRGFAAAYGTYPARHMGLGPDEADPRATPAHSWWDTDPVDVPVSLRERGDRAARGRTARIPDPGLDRERLTAQFEAEQAERQAAAAELAAAGQLNGRTLTPAARDLLLDLVSQALVQHPSLSEPVSITGADLDVTVHAAPSAAEATRVLAHDGDTTFTGLVLHASAAKPAGPPLPAEKPAADGTLSGVPRRHDAAASPDGSSQ